VSEKVFTESLEDLKEAASFALLQKATGSKFVYLRIAQPVGSQSLEPYVRLWGPLLGRRVGTDWTNSTCIVEVNCVSLIAEARTQIVNAGPLVFPPKEKELDVTR
jgi:hypothetical protein